MEETPSLWSRCGELDRQNLCCSYFAATAGTHPDDFALEPLRPGAARLRRPDWYNGPRKKRPVDTVHGGPPSTRAVQTTLCSRALLFGTPVWGLEVVSFHRSTGHCVPVALRHGQSTGAMPGKC